MTGQTDDFVLGGMPKNPAAGHEVCFIFDNVRVMVAGDMGRAFTCSGASLARVAASPPQVTWENNRDG